MPLIKTLALTGLLASQGLAGAIPQTLSLEKWIKTERAIALEGVLDNIGANGTKVAGAGRGLVIASPSKSNPDYFYTWTRDSALTFRTIIDDFLFGNKALQPHIENYIYSQAILQTVSNPSGSLLPNGAGLGEPKFNADGSRYNGNWGRPQRDGPPLRAISLIQYSNYLISQEQKERVKREIWPIISNDLNYVGQYWNATTFDLWEEVSGASFFTTQSQYRALIEGSTLAKSLNLSCPACSQAPQILCLLNSYWNGAYYTANFITSTAGQPTGRVGIDANTILGPIMAFDPNASCNSPTLQPCHPKSLANFKAVVDTFRTLYPINEGIPVGKGIALGRYPEDTYFGGNPWYLIVHGAAEFLYDVALSWSRQGQITITSTSLPFFKDLYPSAKIGTYSKSHPTYHALAKAVHAYADSFIEVSKKYTPSNGMQAEQFLRISPGTPTSAANLTWSFASFISMTHRRDGHLPASWVPTGRNAPVLPQICTPSDGSFIGTFAPATEAGAPNIKIPCLTTVRFMVDAPTYYGENVFITGSTPTLGNWDVSKAYPLLSSNYTAERPLWWADVLLEFEEGFKGGEVRYKYARQQDCGQDWIVEQDERVVTVPGCKVGGSGVVDVVVEEVFNGDGGTPGGC